MKPTSKAYLLLVAFAPVVAISQMATIRLGTWEMKQTSSLSAKGSVDMECVKKSDLGQFSGLSDEEDESSCNYSKGPSTNGKSWSAEKVCADGRKVLLEFTAETSERVVGRIVSSAGPGVPAVTLQMSGKWVSSNCKSEK